MIKIRQLSKSFLHQIIFKNVSLIFPRKGIVGILGPSGSGKTTLINIIALLDYEYEGDYLLDDINMKDITPKERERIRSEYFGVIYQNHALLEDISVLDNLNFIIRARYGTISPNLINKINGIIEMFKLSSLKHNYVRELSLGEKQRVSIARTILLNPRVLVADEPTAALDPASSAIIFAGLKEISKEKLVIVISHNQKMLHDFSQQLYEIRECSLFLLTCDKMQDLRPNFIIKEVKQPYRIKTKDLIVFSRKTAKRSRKRFMIINLVMSLSLLLIGVSVFLSSFLKNTINESYLSIIDGDTTIMESKDQNETQLNLMAVTKEEVETIKHAYLSEIINIGCYYQADFISFFKDDDQFVISNSTYRKILPSFHIELINEFTLIDADNSFGFINTTLLFDEINLGLPFIDMRAMADAFYLQKSYDAINDFLLSNEIFCTFELGNDDWSYHDEQIFRIKEVKENRDATIYHSDALFNEHVYEKMMGIPISSDFSMPDPFPWFFKKTYFIRVLDRSSFLNEVLKSNYFNLFYFSSFQNDKVILFQKRRPRINLLDVEAIMKVDPSISDYFLVTNNSYSIYGGAFLEGFTNPFIVARNEYALDYMVDQYTSFSDRPEATIQDLEGSFTSSFLLKEALKFETIKEELKQDEIVISQGLATLLGLKDGENALHVAYNYETILNGTTLYRSFKKTTLKISGIINSNERILYHNSYWTYSFFINNLEVDSSKIQINGIVLKTKGQISALTINKLNALFPYYRFYSPSLEMKTNLDLVFDALSIGLVVFGFLCFLSALVLLVAVAHSLLYELKHNIAVLKSIGFSNYEITRYLFVTIISSQSLAFLIALISLIVMVIMIISSLQMGFSWIIIIFVVLSLLVMTLIILLASFLSSWIIYHKLEKQPPLLMIRDGF
ncbi:MAG: ATP-binding cassette domain-containing protein [Erysipelotrichaceae bacterium]|jgi:ABC-type lipoprotein export system ATPase subunit/ABC-type antimicrobial peptide transport system permease subunit|nr:ATP-binding cassette domain-containing protein [Erysipelotrichaceae bacterium]